MSWEDLLDERSEQVLPWFGSRYVHSAERTWKIRGPQPREHGWYHFDTGGGRTCTFLGDGELDPSYEEGHPVLRGYLVGNRIIPETSRVVLDPNKLVDQTQLVQCVEPGLERFVRARVVMDRSENLVYVGQEFPQGPESDVLLAYQDRLDSISHVFGVTPSLDLAFRWLNFQRGRAEERRRELERIRAEEERKREQEERVRQAMRSAGTAAGRRALATQDFEGAARAALQVSGAELLDVRDSYERGEKVVQYRFRQQRFECVVNQRTLQIIDSGVCLTDESTGEKGDTWLTLESLPGVVGEAIDQDVLVIYRHVR